MEPSKIVKNKTKIVNTVLIGFSVDVADKVQRFESLLSKCREDIKARKERTEQLTADNERKQVIEHFPTLKQLPKKLTRVYTMCPTL